MGAFYAFFVWVAMWAVPRVVSFFNSIENDEMFILFALGIVFLTAGFAAVMNVPPIIGAFFIGMILAETNVSVRIRSKLESFKDAFVAIFFTSFGMMIDPAMFPDVIWMVALAIPIVILYEVFVLSSITYFLGFSAKASMTIGTSASGRGVESILYASVGSNVKGATMGSLLNPFAGAFCFAMSAISPALVKHSAALADAASKLVPKPVRFSSSIISRTLGKVILPSSLKIFKGARMTGALLISFVALSTAIILVDSSLHLVFVLCGLVMSAAVYFVVRFEVSEVVRHVNYSNIGVRSESRDTIVALVSWVVSGAALSTLVIVSIWTYLWQLSLVVVVAYVLSLVYLMFRTYGRIHVDVQETVPRVYNFPKPVMIEDAGEKELPKPVYGVVRSAPRNARL